MKDKEYIVYMSYELIIYFLVLANYFNSELRGTVAAGATAISISILQGGFKDGHWDIWDI